MRIPIHEQLKIGETDIGSIKIDTRSRDEIPKVLLGLQHIYCTPELNQKVFSTLNDLIPNGTDISNGRPGMELWKIFVLGSLRMNCNWDYDRLKENADNHKTLRQMLGHGFDDENITYPLQTLKDNISLFTPDILKRINQIVVEAGHELVKGKKDLVLNGRCDSFVVKTNVHYPTDTNLLFDAMKKIITLIAILCSKSGLTGWRQKWQLIRKVKRLYRKISKLKHSTSKDVEKKEEQIKKIKKACRKYLKYSESLLLRTRDSMNQLRELEDIDLKAIQNIEYFITHAERQIDQVRRRIILGETIPHAEKVFSIFEPHTEWICKGKAGISQELGLPVCIIEDQYGFILNHRVMQHEKDVDIAVSFTRDTKDKFPNPYRCSYDKGFHSLSNQIELRTIIDDVILPKKGRCNAKEHEREHSANFRKHRRKHSAVESAINALGNHSLDRCPDHGIEGFERYISFAVMARNLQTLGNIIQQRERRREKRSAA